MIQDTAPSERIIIIRPSLKKMCGNSACRAAVFNHMLYWIAYKYKNGEDYWYATGEELHTQMDESWSINIIRREVKALITSGLIGEMHNPKWAADRTKHFFFGKDQARAFFTACTTNKTCPWCIGFPTVILHLLSTHLTNLLNANDSSVKCICQKHQLQLLNLLNGTNRFGTAITKESTKVSTKREDSLVVSANAESDGGVSFLSSLSQFEETLKEVQNGQTPLDVSCSPEGYQQEEPVKEADTSKTPATSAANNTTSDEEALQKKPAQITLLPTYPASPDKTHEKSNRKIRRKIQDCSPEIQARRRKWQAYFNQRRGGEALLTKKDCIAESEAIADLVDRFTDAELEAIDTFVLAEIFPFKVPANKHKLGGCALLRESQNAREVLKDRLKWPGQVIAPVEEPKIVGWTPVRQIYPPKGVTVTYG
jgi:hypothetical protein